VADALAAVVTGPKVVVIKSTVPVGTNRKFAERLTARCRQPVDVASNPEFLKEGAAVDDFMKPDRVVVGVRRPEAGQLLRDLYGPFLRTERPFLMMSPESAEMTKYAANAMLATKISFINEIANFCERLGADINDVRRGIGHDERIGFQFLFPGVGYGGSCFEGSEQVFIANQNSLHPVSLESVFKRAWKREFGGKQDWTYLLPQAVSHLSSQRLLEDEPTAGVVREPNLSVLAFDLKKGKPCAAKVEALTERCYYGPMVELLTSAGISLRVTGDHPVIVRTDAGFEAVSAIELKAGQCIPLLPSLTILETTEALDSRAVLQDAYALTSIIQVSSRYEETTVYSLETSTETVVVASGLVCHNCFPKDVRAMLAMGREQDAPLRLLNAVDEVNSAQKRVLFDKIKRHYGPDLKGKTLAVWGLAFKPRTDDIREAPALTIMDLLLAEGALLRVHDPEAMKNIRQIYGDRLIYCDGPYGTLEGADALAIVTEWQQFRHPNFDMIKNLLRAPVIFDGRNLFEAKQMADLGFTYYSIGR
jgi:UDP-glucose 6-dehydrogenase